MYERYKDDKTRSLLAQIDDCLRDAERLRNHLTNRQPRIWPDRRRASRIPGIAGGTVHDDGDGAR